MKKVCQHPLSSSESDELLYKMFKAWAKKYEKRYETADEENERFKLWRSTKEQVDRMYPCEPGGVTYPLDSFADWTDFEKDQACKGINPFKSNQRTSEFYESKLEKGVAEGEARQHPMSSSESEELLYKMFKDWAKKHKKRYTTADEENKRFKIWCSEKEWIDTHPSLEPGVTYGLNLLSDFTDSEKAEYNGGILVDDPCKGNPRTPEFYESRLGKEVAEAELAFDKWIAKHNREYESNWERENRFAAYFRNKTRIDTLIKENPGCYSTCPHELDIMMDQVLNINLLKSLLNGSAPSN